MSSARATSAIGRRLSMAARRSRRNASFSDSACRSISAPFARSMILRSASCCLSARASLNRATARSRAGASSAARSGFSKYAITPAVRARSIRSPPVWLVRRTTAVLGDRHLARDLDAVAVGKTHGENRDIRTCAPHQSERVGAALGFAGDLTAGCTDGRAQIGARRRVVVEDGDTPAQSLAHGSFRGKGDARPLARNINRLGSGPLVRLPRKSAAGNT